MHEMHAMAISICMRYLKDRILEAVTGDQHYAQVKERLQQNNA